MNFYTVVGLLWLVAGPAVWVATGDVVDAALAMAVGGVVLALNERRVAA